DVVMKHYEQEKDVDGAEEFIEILKKSVDSLGAEVFESLIRTYAAAGRTSAAIQRRLKMENVNVNEDSQKLLEAISVE
ncbi:pentatricopeptide repeat-containing protein, partial [Trifolium medium]|nr:pentatricopeptide repeat-containing protein [Trifolium medium]